MKKVVVIGCGAYMDEGYSCPGEWKCLKAAALGEGKFGEPSQVVAFLRCECPGRPLVANTGYAMKLSEIKPDRIHLSTCMVSAKPDCPYRKVEDLVPMLESKFGVEVVQGTHEWT